MALTEAMQVGMLYLVGTPIGNLDDITMRAVKTLQSVDLIAAEDTRHTGKLLKHWQIDTPQLSYHDHNRHSRIPELIDRLQSGQAIALVTDAGMPGISDPGYELVQACIEADIRVVPIPGVTAVITALTASGLPMQRFVFEGFLPTDNQERRLRLEALAIESRTILIYESPHHLLATLQDLAAQLGATRNIAIARELTKLHEEFWRGDFAGAIAHFTTQTPRGEFTLVIDGAANTQIVWTQAQLLSELKTIMLSGVSRSQASRQLAAISLLPRRQLYQLALSIDLEQSIAVTD